MAIEQDDWRLTGQKQHLQGLSSARRRYTRYSPKWDHDHCSFCWAKLTDTRLARQAEDEIADRAKTRARIASPGKLLNGMSNAPPAKPAPTRIIRAMRADVSGKPRCGSEANMLGVRPGVDIQPGANAGVVGGNGGMSVTPDDPKLLPPHVRPPRFGGKGKLPVFELPIENLGAMLTFRSDPARPTQHGFVEPAEPMQLDEYQAALAASQPAWKAVA